MNDPTRSQGRAHAPSNLPDAQVRAALQESEERYRFLAENIPVQIWTAAPDGQLDYVSNQTARHLGMSPAELLDEGWQGVVHPDDLASAVKRWVSCLASGETYEVQFRLKLASGDYAWHLARAVAQRNGQGAIVRWFGTNTLIDAQREVLRRAEQLAAELAQSEERLRQVVEASGAGLWDYDPGSGRVEADPRFRELAGVALDAPFDLTIGLACTHADDRQRVAEAVSSALAGADGGRYLTEFRVEVGEGVRWVESRGQVSFDAQGKPWRMSGAMIDITARKLADAQREVQRRAEQAALIEREQQHALFMQAPVAIAILEGPDHAFTFANPAYLALVNGRAVVGKPLHEALPDIRGQGFDALLDEVMRTRVPFLGKEVEIPLEHHPEGEALFLNFVYQPKFDADGKVDGVLMTGWDVTELVTARKSLEALAEDVRSREAQLRLVTDAIPMLVSFVGADERYALVNQAYVDWFGQPAEYFVGRAVREVIGEDAYRVLGSTVKRGLAGEAFTFEQVGVPYRFGGTRDVKISYIPHRDQNGTVLGYVALIDDITRRRLFEQERERLHRQRTEMLERQAEFEQQLIGIVSHDLRTPLHTITLATTLLSRNFELEPSAVKVALRAQNAADRATRMVRDLLDFTQARIGGGIPVERRLTDLQTLVDGVMDELEVAFPDRQIAIDHQGNCRGAWDPDRLAQVVQNLVTNALKYSPAGSTVRVATRCAAGTVELSVHNAGAPIPADVLAGLFEPFRRAGKLDRAGRSIGLGLYIVRRIIDAHEGTVSASSSEAEGTEFLVRLPGAAEHTAAPA